MREVDIKIPLTDDWLRASGCLLPISQKPQPVIGRMGVYGPALECGSIPDGQGRLANEEREDAWHEKGSPPDVAPPIAFYQNMFTANVFNWVPRRFACLRVNSRELV